MKRVNLSDEERDFIRTIFEADMYKALPKVLESFVEDLVEDLLRYNVQIGSDRDLAYKKAHIDGAKALIGILANYRKSLVKS